jgi:predicted NBD/HSP70 family sugar kinase
VAPGQSRGRNDWETLGLDEDDPANGLLGLIANGDARTRSELIKASGLSRATVTKRLQQLLDAQLVSEEGTAPSSGGRPSRTLTFNQSKGVVIGVDVGETHTRVAVTDLAPNILAQDVAPTDVKSGPESILSWVSDEIMRLLTRIDRPIDDVVGICLGLPAPIDWKRGQVVGPSVMVGWDEIDIRQGLREMFKTPVVVDNDVNLLGLAEYRRHRSAATNLLFVKCGTGIGSSLVVRGDLYRGAFGSAGDIGHVYLPGETQPLCRCGNVGCVEAVAGGWALARDLREQGLPADSARDVVTLARQGTPEAIRLLRQAGRALGEAIASAISLVDPDILVLGGVLATEGDHLISGVREVVYRRALPLSTRNLRIQTSIVDGSGGVLGASQLVVDRLIPPTKTRTRR